MTSPLFPDLPRPDPRPSPSASAVPPGSGGASAAAFSAGSSLPAGVMPGPRSRRCAVLPVLFLPLLTACVPPGPAPVAVNHSVSYQCVAENAAPPPPRHGRATAAAAAATESIIIAFSPQGRPITLDVGVPLRNNYVLEQLPGTPDLFSAGDSYGWRGGPEGGVLTNVPSATQFRCQPRPAAMS